MSENGRLRQGPQATREAHHANVAYAPNGRYASAGIAVGGSATSSRARAPIEALARDIDYSESRYTAARWVFGRNAYTTSCEESKAIVWASRPVAIVPTRRNCAVSKISMTPGSPTAT